VPATFAPTAQECRQERDACVAEGGSSNPGTCESAKLADVQRTCPYPIETIESCGREVLRAAADSLANASCDRAGQSSSPFSGLSSACQAMFQACAIWGI
jgi:hypothetical protein